MDFYIELPAPHIVRSILYMDNMGTCYPRAVNSKLCTGTSINFLRIPRMLVLVQILLLIVLYLLYNINFTLLFTKTKKVWTFLSLRHSFRQLSNCSCLPWYPLLLYVLHGVNWKFLFLCRFAVQVCPRPYHAWCIWNCWVMDDYKKPEPKEAVSSNDAIFKWTSCKVMHF